MTATQSERRIVLSDVITRTAHESLDAYGYVLPKDTYTLSAEDKDYWYYQASDRIVLVVRKSGRPEDGRAQKGGIFVAKQNGAPGIYPAGAYIDWEDGKKLLVVTLDSDFFAAEGRWWHYEPGTH